MERKNSITHALGTRSEKGTGFGLKLCEELLVLLESQLIIESTQGKGTRVTIQFIYIKILIGHSMRNYTAIIIDDELENIQLLKVLLSKYCPDIEVVSVGTNVKEGVSEILEYEPDILFLDIKLDNDTSFEILNYLDHVESEIIFVSSYEEYAIKAIEHNAAGYVLKPIETSKLIEVVKKTTQKIVSKDEGISGDKESHLIAIPYVNTIEIINSDEIIYLEADGRYTIFHLISGKTKIASRNLGEYEKLLPKHSFFRIHHRHIVNLNMVKNINKAAGNYMELKNDISLPIAKRRQEKLHRFLKIK